MRFAAKIMLCVVVLLSLAYGVGGSLLISVSYNEAIAREREMGLGAHQLITYTFSAVSSARAGTTGALEDGYVDALEQLEGYAAGNWEAIRLSDDRVILYSNGDQSGFSNTLFQRADEGHKATCILRGADGGYYLQIAGQIAAPENVLYLETLHDISSIYVSRDTQIQIYRRLFAAIIFVGALVSWLLASWLTKPLRKLSATVRKIASGDLSGRVQVRSQDEVGKLAADFNHMADQLEENIHALKEAVKRQEEFNGSFAHELKTPMTSIIGYADLLRSHDLSEKERREAANYIFSEGKRIESLSLKMLDLIVMKKRDFTMEPCNLQRFVTDIVKVLAPILKKQGIALSSRAGRGICLLEPDLVRSLLVNLVDNARKAMDNGGSIRIDAKTTEDGCILCVTDTGRGMPADELSRITEAFYRVDKSRSRAQGGVGLGLALCSEIAALHNGGISFESVVGKGTRVTVSLKGGVL